MSSGDNLTKLKKINRHQFTLKLKITPINFGASARRIDGASARRIDGTSSLFMYVYEAKLGINRFHMKKRK